MPTQRTYTQDSPHHHIGSTRVQSNQNALQHQTLARQALISELWNGIFLGSCKASRHRSQTRQTCCCFRLLR
uniref:Uncharacterized protein n=1 Tax=Rhizophora mucronata TaxID=61149 RepID=A0A2P2Q8M9_RHIMU